MFPIKNCIVQLSGVGETLTKIILETYCGVIRYGRDISSRDSWGLHNHYADSRIPFGWMVFSGGVHEGLILLCVYRVEEPIV